MTTKKFANLFLQKNYIVKAGKIKQNQGLSALVEKMLKTLSITFKIRLEKFS